MNRKNIVIIALMIFAVTMFCIIQFLIFPANQGKQAEYEQSQTDALNHDISVVEGFKSPYIGDAGNVINLFWSLPLNDIPMKFQIDSIACTLTVSYLDTVWEIGEEKVRRDLLYNAIAAMATIDNLTAITFEFPGDSFFFEREQIETVFGSPLSDLLVMDIWKEQIQDQLAFASFTEQFYQE